MDPLREPWEMREWIRRQQEWALRQYLKFGTVITDWEDESVSNTAVVLAECDALEAKAKGDGVAALPNLGVILEIVGLIRDVAAFVDSNPQLEAFVRSLLDRIQKLFASENGGVV